MIKNLNIFGGYLSLSCERNINPCLATANNIIAIIRKWPARTVVFRSTSLRSIQTSTIFAYN